MMRIFWILGAIQSAIQSEQYMTQVQNQLENGQPKVLQLHQTLLRLLGPSSV